MSKFITDDIKVSSDDSDKADSDEENCGEEHQTKTFFLEKYNNFFRFGATNFLFLKYNKFLFFRLFKLPSIFLEKL